MEARVRFFFSNDTYQTLYSVILDAQRHVWLTKFYFDNKCGYMYTMSVDLACTGPCRYASARSARLLIFQLHNILDVICN